MKKVMVETSARHVHVNEKDSGNLFGLGYDLHTREKPFPAMQYASDRARHHCRAKGEIAGISILGPTRGATQVEISLTDARKLGVVPPVRER